MKKTDTNQVKEIKKLLDQQTLVILNAVDERIGKSDLRMNEKLQKMELRINQKIEKLTTTLDAFLKRLTDMEDEFEIMKADINRMKKIIRQKLGVEVG